MIRYSNAYLEDIKKGFHLDSEQLFSETSVYSINQQDYNLFNKFLKIDISQDSIEIPTFAAPFVESALAFNYSNRPTEKISPFDKIVIPMYISYTNNSSSADFIVRKFLSARALNDRLIKIVTSKGDVFYGGKGLILDANFNPLLVCSVTFKVEDYSIENPVLNISPDVFINNDDVVKKSIIRKALPCFLYNNSATIHTELHSGISIGNTTIKTVINKFPLDIIDTSHLDINTNSKDQLKDLLLRHKEDFFTNNEVLF